MKMSSQQSTLVDGPSLNYAPTQVVEAPDINNNLLDQYGLEPRWLGKQPYELDDVDDLTFWRYQFDRIYFYVRSDDDAGSELQPVEFRTFIYTVGKPTGGIRDFIKDHANPRLQYIYDSGPYEGYMTGFNFPFHSSNIEDDEVAADEASNLGIPQFEVLVSENSRVRGQATGFFDPFGIKQKRRVKPTAGQEVWNLSYNNSRESYQVTAPPRSRSSQRAKQISGKAAYVNGKRVGDVTSDGRVWIKKSYQSNDQRYRGMVSREFLVNNTDATYSAIRDGGNLYKTRETDSSIYFVTAKAKPADFNPVDADEIDPSATGEVIETRTDLVLEEDVETDFNIRNEEGMLSRHNTPTIRSTDVEADFDTTPYGVRS